MEYAKYIVIANPSGFETAILFPSRLNHKDVAKALGPQIGGSEYSIVGAGQVGFYAEADKIMINCYGESVTLGVRSREGLDSVLIKREILSTF